MTRRRAHLSDSDPNSLHVEVNRACQPYLKLAPGESHIAKLLLIHHHKSQHQIVDLEREGNRCSCVSSAWARVSVASLLVRDK